MTGTTIAARLVIRFGIDGITGLGSCALAVGGLGMVAAVALGFNSAVSLVLPVAIYLAGLGMVLPQAIAGAMTPFPERAGAASACLASSSNVPPRYVGHVGWLLGENAWPLAAAVAAMGCATLIIWISTAHCARVQRALMPRFRSS